MPAEFDIAPAQWPRDIEHARALLIHYGDFLAASPVGSAGVSLIGYEAELQALPEKYAREDADLLLARLHGDLAGCVAVSHRVLEDGKLAAEMKRLWVEPAFRGQRLGFQLIKAAITWAQTHGCAAVALDTIHDAMPEAVALYQSLGFHETHRFNDNPIPGVRFYILNL
jgi:putative acetyltransferase